ncbi:hypothetical protein KKD70_03440 [Patescibacteria group bacterium]|nr:hypothetical protein [Patescibacteria group bacterium]
MIKDLSQMQILDFEKEIKKIAGPECTHVDIIKSGESVFIYNMGYEPLTGVRLVDVKKYLAQKGVLSFQETYIDFLDLTKISKETGQAVMLLLQKKSTNECLDAILAKKVLNPVARA